MYGPWRFFTRRLHWNDEKKPKIWCAHWRKLQEAALQRGIKCCMHQYHEGEGWAWCFRLSRHTERRQGACPTEEPVTPPCSRLHILSPAGEAAWLCPSKPSVSHRVYGMLLHAFAYVCNCVWKFSPSHSVCFSVSVYTVVFTVVFLLFLFICFNSDSREVDEGRITMLPLGPRFKPHQFLSSDWIHQWRSVKFSGLFTSSLLRYQVLVKTIQALLISLKEKTWTEFSVSLLNPSTFSNWISAWHAC